MLGSRLPINSPPRSLGIEQEIAATMERVAEQERVNETPPN